MPEFLVLRFSATPTDPVEWLLVDQSGGQLGGIERGDLQACADAAQGRRVVALVPSTNVLRTVINLPVRNQAKMLQAIPFAMEDQLAGDVDDLHFAVGRRDDQGRVPVAVVDRLKMEAWLEQISAVELDLVGVYMDGDVLGDMPNTTVILAEDQRVTLRDAEGNISAADLPALDALVDLWLSRHKTTEDEELPPPLNLLVYLTAEAAGEIQPVLDRLRSVVESLDVVELPEGGLPRLAAQSIVAPGINLLQGAYTPRSKIGAYWPVWRVAAMLLVGFSIVLAGAKILEISSLNREAAALDQSIEQAMRYTFPEIREVRDARAMLDSKLRTLGQAAGDSSGNEFLVTLERVATAVNAADASAVSIESINFRSGMMELRILAPNVDALDSIRKSIALDSGLQAEIQSANPDGDGVLGRLQIKPAGA